METDWQTQGVSFITYDPSPKCAYGVAGVVLPGIFTARECRSQVDPPSALLAGNDARCSAPADFAACFTPFAAAVAAFDAISRELRCLSGLEGRFSSQRRVCLATIEKSQQSFMILARLSVTIRSQSRYILS